MTFQALSPTNDSIVQIAYLKKCKPLRPIIYPRIDVSPCSRLLGLDYLSIIIIYYYLL